MKNEDVILIKIGKSYRQNITDDELYLATSRSWVVNLEGKDIKYFCAVVDKKIIEVYSFISSELNLEKVAYFDDLEFKDNSEPSKSNRYILHGELAPEDIRKKLIGLDVSEIHKGKGNPIKYVKLTDLIGIEENSVMNVDEGELQKYLYDVESFIKSKGFLYSKKNIQNLYLSLKSKPFVILSGISGTGKTKIVELFAEAVGATHENNRYMLIPVRPDWSDSSDLLGYTDIQGKYVEGPLTKMIRRAEENPDYPHFVVLDEMNLARVEYYLSDFLSVIESRRLNGDGKIGTAPIGNFKNGIPDNLYIIGTVNMDETTHPFSKKVLDRANTIEFNEVHLMNFNFLKEQSKVEPLVVSNDVFKSKYVQLRDAKEFMDEIRLVSEELEKLNQILAKIYAQVGYRVRDEIAFYMSYNEEYQLLTRDEAMDFCIMQKILPRLAGAGAMFEDVLKELFKFTVGPTVTEDIQSKVELPANTKYPRSAAKLREMNNRLKIQGFVSFWIS